MTKMILIILVFCLIFIQKIECELDKDTIEQKLDHFNEIEDRVFQQDYYFSINTTAEIVFLYLSGEKALNKSEGILSGEIPPEIPLSYFNLIHRFYGDTPPLMPPTEYIKYINTSQSLADIKNFIEKMNERFNLQNSHWIIAGCFYSGTLAALARHHYPSLIKGAVAVSAPLNPSLYIDFMDTVIEKMKAIDENKTAKAQDAIATYYNYTTTLEGQVYLSELVQDDYFMQNDTECFPPFYDPTKFFANAVESGTILEFFEKWEDESFESFMDLILLVGIRNTTENETEARQEQAWQHQLCTEFGYFRTTSTQKSIDFFGNSMPKACPEIICDQLEKNVFENLQYTFEDSISGIEKTAQFFGNTENFNATNVIFIIPEYDPWEQTFLLVTEHPGIEIIFSENQFHCGVDEKSQNEWISTMLKWIYSY